MTRDELKIKLTELFPTATIDESGEWLCIDLDAQNWLASAQSIRNTPELNFNFLFCMTGVDWSKTPAGNTHLSMVYHFTSTKHRQPLVVKIKLEREKPEVESVAHIWRTAEFNERECFEMFGVIFLNHPDLRLLILPDGWEGRNPMRKDFEDPVNMIKL